MGAEMYYVLLPPFRRKGYGQEMAEALLAYAFEVLQIGRLVCFVAPENRAGMRAAEALQMVDEGLTEHEAYPSDVHQYAIWRKNWEGTDT